MTWDAVVVVVPSPARARWWEARLPGTTVVVETWPAGNGLGTLLAAREAGALDRMHRGEAVAVFHTAGRGTRLAPLPLAEGGDKAAVRVGPRTILEAVLVQTAPYAPFRRGRLSVFWGDQLFLPRSYAHRPTHPVDLLARMGAVDPAYGVVARGEHGALQVEKPGEALSRVVGDRPAGTSLGCFSLSVKALQALIDTFTPELDARRGRLDSDPHLWMPLTLPEDVYVALGHDRGHHRRLRPVRDRLGEVLGIVDVGRDAPWWDLGTLRSWYRHLVRPDPRLAPFLGGPVQDVVADEVDARDSVLIGVRARRVHARGAVAYGVHAEDLALAPGEVAVDVVVDGVRHRLRTTLDRDGAADWDAVLPGNFTSYDAVWQALTR